MDIVTCLDKNYVMPTGVMMSSVCLNNLDASITFHLVIDDSVDEADKQSLVKNISSFMVASVTFYSVNGLKLSILPAIKSERMTLATYYRLFLEVILPRDLHKVLYLDGDIIVRHSLRCLWDTDITDYALAAVPDVNENNLNFYNRLKYPSTRGYFNAGVLLINLDYWRSYQALSHFFTFLESHRTDIVYHDQDILNAVFYDRKRLMPIKYNVTNQFLYANYDYSYNEKQVIEARTNPVIIHYTPKKPWAYDRFLHPYESSFHKFKNLTIWKNIPKVDKRSKRLRLRHMISDSMRKLGLWPAIPKIFVELSPID